MCVYSMVETEEHLLKTCDMYKDERDIWLNQWRSEQMGDEDDLVGLKGYDIPDEYRLDKSAMTFLSKLWQRRTSME